MLNNDFQQSDGMIGDATGPGLQTLEKYFPGAVMTGNYFDSPTSGVYPPDNFKVGQYDSLPPGIGVDTSLLPKRTA